MIRVRTEWWKLLSLFACLVASGSLTAGDDNKAPMKAATNTAVEPQSADLLPGFPKPPDQPANLYQPAPNVPYVNGDPMPPRYFEFDPAVDRPNLLPGWFTSIDAAITDPHLINRLTNSLQPANFTQPVSLPSAPLNWTVFPRVELGYRIPEGFGEAAVVYRGMASHGTCTTQGPDVPAVLRSRFDLNSIDLDYASSEFSLGDTIAMKWRVGIRYTSLYFDSQMNQGGDAVLNGTGILSQRETNSYWGIGPHAGLMLAWNPHLQGLQIIGSTDVADSIGRIRQQYFEDTFQPATPQSPLAQSTSISSSQSVPSIMGRVGLGYTPPQMSQLRLFTGYEYQYWWNVGRLSLITARGELWTQGLVLQAQLNY